MKKLIRIASLILALMLCAAAFAETKITVNGSGLSLVPADTAIISMGVRKNNASVKEAQNEVNEIIAAIRAALIENGIKEEDINTDRIYVNPRYDYTHDYEEIIGYSAFSYLSVKTENMNAIGTIVDLALDAGANMLENITFSAKDTSAAQQVALTEAVKNARRDAEIIANAAGLEIVSIESISEGRVMTYDSGSNAFYKMTAADMAVEEAASGASTYVQAAKLQVTNDVTVVFICK